MSKAGFSLTVLACQAQTAIAQPTFDPSDPNVPLDGGLIWLLLAGAGYGAKKIYDQRKKKNI